jgi:hypothetical protein
MSYLASRKKVFCVKYASDGLWTPGPYQPLSDGVDRHRLVPIRFRILVSSLMLMQIRNPDPTPCFLQLLENQIF